MSKKIINRFKTALLIIIIVIFLAAAKISSINRIFMSERIVYTVVTAKVLPEVDIKGIDCESVVS